MRVVLDTNVFVRCTRPGTGPARACLALLREQGHDLFVSPYLLRELERVLSYPRLQAQHCLSPAAVRSFVDAVKALAIVIDPLPARSAGRIPDDLADEPILHLADAGSADVLCTLDRHFSHPEVLTFCHDRGIRVLTDTELLGFLRSNAA